MMRVMVFIRLCNPESKLGVLRWLERVCLPGIDASGIAYQYLLRTMDAVSDEPEKIDEMLYS